MEVTLFDEQFLADALARKLLPPPATSVEEPNSSTMDQWTHGPVVADLLTDEMIYIF